MGTGGRFSKRIGFIIFFLGGVVLGYILAHTLTLGEQKSLIEGLYPIRVSNKEMPLVRPLIAYEIPEASVLEEYASLKDRISDIIENHKKTGGIRDASVYYRSLKVGRWIGINQSAVYHPASLLKIPIMIAYYKQEESDPLLFRTRITYRPITGGNAFETSSALTNGATYTVQELIERMIADSDNGATFTLLSRIDENVLREVYTDIGIEDPGDNSASYKISTKTYALFFRILYNATYLSPQSSEKALESLSHATYANGLRAGVPETVPIAHKFGEHVSEGASVNGVELHDCGIVYHPVSHYVLCVMTHANDLPAAEALISDISKTVYELEN